MTHMTPAQISKMGGPAFPVSIPAQVIEVMEKDGIEAIAQLALGMPLLDYFAAHEVTSPPPNFLAAELGNGTAKTLGPKGQTIKTGPPSPEDVAAALAKWRYLCAAAMLNERHRRGA